MNAQSQTSCCMTCLVDSVETTFLLPARTHNCLLATIAAADQRTVSDARLSVDDPEDGFILISPEVLSGMVNAVHFKCDI
jgi:hypothetical protein